MHEAKKAPAISDETKRKHTVRNPVRTDGEMQVSSQELGYLEDGSLEPTVENHAALLANPRLSHPANAWQKARIVNQLQQHYGNGHVQKVVQRLQASAQNEPEQESLENTVEDLQQQRGSRHPMKGETHKERKQSLGYDFGHVRIHTDGPAHKAAEEFNAKAFTKGADIILSQKQGGNLSSSDARGLLAHELTNVVQQSEENLTLHGSKVKMGQVGDRYEREADVVAEGVVMGEQRIHRQAAEEEEEQMLQTKAANEGVQRQAEAEEGEELLEGIAGNRKNETSLKSGKNDTNIIARSPDIQHIEELIIESPPDQNTALLKDPRLSLPPNTEQKTRVQNQLQRNLGNAYVQRTVAPRPAQVSPSPGIIQLQGGGPAKEVKTGLSTSVPVNKSVPGLPFKLQEISASGEIAGTVAEKGASESAKVSMGTTHLGYELEKKWVEVAKEGVGKISVSSKGEAQITKDGADVGVTVATAKFGKVAVGLKIVVFNVDWKTSKIDIGEIHAPVSPMILSGQTKTADGTTFSYEAKYTLTFEFSVDYAKVAKWLARTFSKAITGEALVAGSFIVGGVITLAAAYANIAAKYETQKLANEAIKITNEFCAAYAATMTGGEPNTKSQFGQQGAAAARSAIKASGKPPEAVFEAAKGRNLRDEAFAIAWPKVKETIMNAYREEHPLETFFYGEKAGKELQWILEAGEENIRKETYYEEWSW
jgi:hypothetical protein